MPRRPKVVDLQTGLEAPPPGLRELLAKLPSSEKERRASVKKLGGVAAVRRGLLTILAGCARDDFGMDERVFDPACELLETLGPGKDPRFLALARSGRFGDDRSSRILRAASRKAPAETRGSRDLVEFGRKHIPMVRDTLLMPGGADIVAENVRDHGGFAMIAEVARCEVGVPARAVWERVLRDPATSENVRDFAVDAVGLEGTPDARALLSEVLPTLPPELGRRAFAALNRHPLPENRDPPGTPTERGWSIKLGRPKLDVTLPDAHGDVAILSEEDGLDGGHTFAWLLIRLGSGIRRGGVTTNLSLAKLSDAVHDALGYGELTLARPDIAVLAPLVHEALRARPSARFTHATRLGLQLVQREIAFGRQEARRRPPFDSALPSFETADLAAWRNVLAWTSVVHSWFLDAGDLAALGADRPDVAGLERPNPPSGMSDEAWKAWSRADRARRHGLIPEAWVQDVLRRLPGTPLLPRLERSLRHAALVNELRGRRGAPELLTRTADALRDTGPAHPIVRAWVERSLFPDLDHDVTNLEDVPFDSDLWPLVDELAAQEEDRRGLRARMERATKRAVETLRKADATRFAEERPTWDEAVLEAWEATART